MSVQVEQTKKEAAIAAFFMSFIHRVMLFLKFGKLSTNTILDRIKALLNLLAVLDALQKVEAKSLRCLNLNRIAQELRISYTLMLKLCREHFKKTS